MAALDARDDKPSLLLLLVDALAFLLRQRGLFLVIVLPIAGLAAGIAWALESQHRLVAWRGHWGWDFLFVLVYALLLDRWVKESLLDGAGDYDETDDLRRSLVSPRFLLFVASLFVLAAALITLPIALPIEWFGGTGAVLAKVLTWAPHFVLWTMAFALFALYLPALAAAEPLSLLQALRLGRSVRPTLVTLILGVALLSLLGQAAAQWLPLHLRPKPWILPAMAAAHRFFDCVLLALVGHVLASLFQTLADWRQPEPDDHAYRDLRKPRRKVPSR
jgi:hypothetical protein